jgi:predicted glycoside hydrolase/deacetylase ChbG (UPF0249 family)
MADGNAPFLVVNADDLGMSPGVNAAIFEGHDHGIITSTSLMAAGPAFDAAVQGVRARPRLGCGVHLVLHDERHLAPKERVPHLALPDGKMRPLGPTLRALLSGKITEDEIEAEYGAQIERVLAAGIRPTHLDSHCHLHGFSRAGKVLHRLGRKHGIPWARRPEVSGLEDFRGSPVSRFPVAILISASHRRTRANLADRLRMPDRFLGLVRSGAIDAAWVERAVAGIRDGEICELMVHPGDGSAAGMPEADHGPAARARELAAVLSPAVRAAIERRGARLVNYAELPC